MAPSKTVDQNIPTEQLDKLIWKYVENKEATKQSQNEKKKKKKKAENHHPFQSV